ncbi:MAG: trypsin-like peptidase domain-containing protein [Ideonella sp.]
MSHFYRSLKPDKHSAGQDHFSQTSEAAKASKASKSALLARRHRTAAWIALGAGLLPVGLRAVEPPAEDEYERTAVRIGCFVKGQDGKPRLTGTGSGFLIGDRRHLVTNAHVARSDGCKQGVAAVMLAGRELPLKLLTYSDVNDLALLESEGPIDEKDPITTLIVGRDVPSRYEVYVVGFPGIVDSIAIDTNLSRPTTTRGIVGRKIETAEGVGMLQVDARTISGNSGGPWLDDCGRLVGIHSRGNYKPVVGVDQQGKPIVDKLPVGYGYAIQTDHLLPLLDQAKVDYRLAGSCGFVLRHAEPLAWSAALLLGSGVLLRFSPPGQRLWQQLAVRVAGPLSAAGSVPVGPHLVGLSGALRGVTIELAGGPVVIGRDARVSSLALPASCDDVSKRHCLVRVDPQGQGFVLEDCWSTNGCFLASGERLAPGSSRHVPAGTRFYLADASQMFELRPGNQTAGSG